MSAGPAGTGGDVVRLRPLATFLTLVPFGVVSRDVGDTEREYGDRGERGECGREGPASEESSGRSNRTPLEEVRDGGSSSNRSAKVGLIAGCGTGASMSTSIPADVSTGSTMAASTSAAVSGGGEVGGRAGTSSVMLDAPGASGVSVSVFVSSCGC